MRKHPAAPRDTGPFAYGAVGTTWRDYNANPELNNSPPPAGAPEFMPTTQVNNVQREVMSVIRQMGDEFEAGFDDLGTMAAQNSDNVAITGGAVAATLAGPGAGITNLKAQALIEGPIPAAVFPSDAAPLNVKVARAGVADSLSSSLSILPVGSIIMWYSANPIPAGWRLCDGGGGTPNLVARHPLGAGPGVGLGQMAGQFTVGAATDVQGAHDHGPQTGGTVLTEAQMPSHNHFQIVQVGSGGGTGPAKTSGAAFEQSGTGTAVAGGNQPHSHSIAVTGNHAHNVTVTTQPPYTAVYFIMRVS